MPNYAIIQAGVVANVIDADSAFIAANYSGAAVLIDAGQRPGVGWSYDGTSFTPPTATPPPAAALLNAPQPSPIFRRTDFMKLFTDAELQSILTFQTSTTLTDAQKTGLTEFVEFFRDADTVDVSDATTTSGVGMLASFGLITSARAMAILAARH